MAQGPRRALALLKSGANSKWLVIFILASGLSLALLRAVALHQARAAWTGVTALLRNESNLSNSYQIARTLADLEKVGWIKCVVLTETTNGSRVFYDTSSQSYCGHFAVAAVGDVASINGATWRLSIALEAGIWFQLLALIIPVLILILEYMAYQHLNMRQIEHLHLTAKESMFAQIAHDIRSPLSALNMLLGSLNELSEEKRSIIRKASQRINDIANGLLPHRSDAPSSRGDRVRSRIGSAHSEPVLLAAVIDSLVSEKRVQYRERMNLEIDADLSKAYGLFVETGAIELSRAISNLVNNSVEAIEDAGKVNVAIRPGREQVSIIVSDNGKGIMEENLAKLGERGVSFGKAGTSSGSGLGLNHARSTVETAGGKFSIQSRMGAGTMVTLTLPNSTPPDWFVIGISLAPDTEVVSIDDDQTIHQIWASRLSRLKGRIRHLKFSSIELFEKWHAENETKNPLFLVDFEFLNQSGNGVDLMKRTNIAANSILVTSRYDDPRVRFAAAEIKVKLLPKSMAPIVPIAIIE